MRNALLWNRNLKKDGSRNWLNSAKKFWVENTNHGNSVYIEDIGYKDPAWVVKVQMSYLTLNKDFKEYHWEFEGDIWNANNSMNIACMFPNYENGIFFKTRHQALKAYLKYKAQ